MPGRAAWPLVSPGLTSALCCPSAIAFTPRFLGSKNPRLVDGLAIGGRWGIEDEGRGASSSSSAWFRVLSCACVAAWGSTVVRFISAARVLERLDFGAEGCELVEASWGRPEMLAARLSIEGFAVGLGFDRDGRYGFAGVLVGESDTGNAKAADTFLLCGKGFEVSADTVGFFGVAMGLGIWLEVAVDSVAVFVVWSISAAKGFDEILDTGFDVEAIEGNKSRCPIGNLGWPGVRAGVRTR